MSNLLIKDLYEISIKRKELKLSYFQKWLEKKTKEMCISGSLDKLNNL